jgi:hypothetical protein
MTSCYRELTFRSGFFEPGGTLEGKLTMKRRSILLALATVLLLAAAPAVEAAPPNPFTGAWTSTDLDGSTQYATISGGDVVKIVYTDLRGGVCVNKDAPTFVFSSIIVGTVTNDSFEGSFASARCGSVYFDSLVGRAVTLRYDPETDTIFDGSVTWYRL